MLMKLFSYALLALVLVCSAMSQGASASKPNIIFIFADDWGYGDLGIHGSTFCKTPHLDQMAAEGIDFQNFTVNSPVCSPSRAAVMTGHFPARHSIHQHFSNLKHHIKSGMPDWLDPQAVMLPRILKESGYVTAHFGKWHLSNDQVVDAPLPPDYGYDEYGAFNLPASGGEQMKTTSTCPRAVDFIRRNKDQPFFINLWLHETHTPHYPLQQYLDQFEDLDEQKKVYAAVVAEGDAGVGMILKTLEELGLDDNTLVIFSSDNGPEFTGTADKKQSEDASTGPGLSKYYSVGEVAGLKGQKRSLYAGGIRVPFIARWPKVIPAGKIDRDSVLTAVDILPTFVEIAGAQLPEAYQPDGVSVVRALKGEKGEAFVRGKPIFWQWKPAKRNGILWPYLGIRDGDWKLLFNEKLNQVELYNIAQDWAEADNVASENPELVNSLKLQLKAWESSLPTEVPEHCLSQER